jgi:hypothetical protein
MNDKKNTAAATSKKASRDFLQGRMLSLEFFKRNWVYAVFIVAMALAYIGNKFACQRSIQELLSLKNYPQQSFKFSREFWGLPYPKL